MATRLYLPSTAEAVPGYAPAVAAEWEISSSLVRSVCRPSPKGNAMATESFADNNASNRDICFHQFISDPLTIGQTITGSQALEAQLRCSQVATTNNLFLTIGVRVIAADGSTVRKDMATVVRDGIPANISPLMNRRWTTTSAATNYTTVAGDRLVIEIGIGGDPDSGSDHDSSIRFGDAAASDLPEDDTDTNDLRPWIEFTDTLLFTVQELLIKPMVSVASPIPFIGAAMLAASMMPNLLGTTLVPAAEPPPISQTDWPNPLRAAPHTLSWVQTRPEYYVDETPAHQTDWPLPQRLAPHTLTWLQARQDYLLVDASPFNQFDWPLPLVASRPHVGTVQARPSFYEEPVPFIPFDWPTPGRVPWLLTDVDSPIVETPAEVLASGYDVPLWTPRYRFEQDGAPNLLTTTLAAAPAATPFTPIDWPNPALTRPPAATWLQTRPIFAIDEPTRFAPDLALPLTARTATLTWIHQAITAASPFAQFDWPLPQRLAPQTLTWIQTRPVLAVDEPTRFIPDLSLPLQPRPQTLTWIQPALTEIATPFIQGATDLPLVPRAQTLTWVQARPSYYIEPPAVGRSSTDLPAPARTVALSWIEGRKPYYEDAVPAHQTDWPVPGRVAPQTLTWLQTRPVFAVDEPTRAVADLSLPPARPAPALTWTQSLQLATVVVAPMPFASGDWPVPARRAPQPLTWTQTRPVFAVDAPIAFAASWPNPAPRPVPGLTWTQNLLQATLTPGVPPPSSGDWPLPQRLARHTLTWTPDRCPALVASEVPFVPVAWVNPAPWQYHPARFIIAPTNIAVLPPGVFVRRMAQWRVGRRTTWRM